MYDGDGLRKAFEQVFKKHGEERWAIQAVQMSFVATVGQARQEVS
jgi:hypothetical protein